MRIDKLLVNFIICAGLGLHQRNAAGACSSTEFALLVKAPWSQLPGVCGVVSSRRPTGDRS
jgi:hypothetical protein